MKMTLVLAFGIIAVLQAFGDIISAKTNGKLPSIFVAMVLFLIGFWTVIPTTIPTPDGGSTTLLALSGISGPLFTLLLTLLVTNMGSLMSMRELLAQWKTIIIGLAGVAGVMVFCYFVGGIIFGREYGLVVAPPLSGGLAAMDIMVKAANEIGRTDLAIIAALTFAIQGLLGYPIMTFALRKQAVHVLADYQAGKIQLLAPEQNSLEKKSAIRFIPELPAKYNTPTVLIAKVALVAYLADVAARATGGLIHPYVMCLVLGITASEIGFLDKKILNRSETMGLLMILLMGFVFGGLAAATPEKMQEVFVPLIGTMFIGTAGIVAFGIIAGKIFGETWAMSTAIVINCLCGFPPNYILTNEASQAMSSNQDEYNLLMQEMLPKVLVGGFVTVTVSSVMVANIFVKMM